MARQEISKSILGQRLRDIRKAAGYNEIPSFSKILGVPKSTLGNYERGDRDPTFLILELYATKFSVNLHWLLTGQGEMFVGQSAGQTRPQKADINLDYLTDALEAIEEGQRQAGKTLTPAKKAELLKIVYGMISDRKADKRDFIRLIAAA